MSKIVYIKLVTGEELFAECLESDSAVVNLRDIMVMETVASDDNVKYMFLSRYAPYTKDQDISIDRDKIVVISDVMQVAQDHYEKAVLYARKYSDHKFIDGIRGATSYLESVLNRSDIKENEETLPAFFMVDKPTTTKH